jgi:hypothetical protein
VPYEWEEWGLQSLVGIEAYEVRQVLDGKLRRPRAALDPTTGLGALLIYGRTIGGRPLVVGVRHLEGFTWKIISAREMTADESAEFARWEKTR